MRQHIKIKLKRSEVEALHSICAGEMAFSDPVGYAEIITEEMMIDVIDQLEKMQANGEQKKFSLKLTGAQSMAFVAFFMRIDLKPYPFERVIIHRIFETIHKTNINAKNQTTSC